MKFLVLSLLGAASAINLKQTVQFDGNQNAQIDGVSHWEGSEGEVCKSYDFANAASYTHCGTNTKSVLYLHGKDNNDGNCPVEGTQTVQVGDCDTGRAAGSCQTLQLNEEHKNYQSVKISAC